MTEKKPTEAEVPGIAGAIAEIEKRNGGPSLRITPKGWLKVRLDLSLADADQLWNDLTAFVAKQAASDGMTKGIPCLVLVEGGHCIAAEKGQGAQ